MRNRAPYLSLQIQILFERDESRFPRIQMWRTRSIENKALAVSYCSSEKKQRQPNQHFIFTRRTHFTTFEIMIATPSPLACSKVYEVVLFHIKMQRHRNKVTRYMMVYRVLLIF